MRSVTPSQAQELLTRDDVEVVDVRETREWSTGHLPGAKHIPFEALRRSPKALLSRTAVLFVCAAGMRSEAAARLAASQGMAEVYNLTGGTRGWSRAGFPLVRE